MGRGESHLPSNCICRGVAVAGREGGEDEEEQAGVRHLEIQSSRDRKEIISCQGLCARQRAKKCRSLPGDGTVLYIGIHNGISQNLRNCTLERANVTARLLYLITKTGLCHPRKFQIQRNFLI